MLTVLAGDQPGAEEVLRTLRRGEEDQAQNLWQAWPVDLRTTFEAVLSLY